MTDQADIPTAPDEADVPLRALARLAQSRVEEAPAWEKLSRLVGDARELDRLIAAKRLELAAAERETAAAAERLAEASAEVDEAVAAGQKRADEIVAAANRTRADADRLVAAAERQVALAEAKSKKIIDDAEAKRTRINEQIDAIRRAT